MIPRLHVLGLLYLSHPTLMLLVCVRRTCRPGNRLTNEVPEDHSVVNRKKPRHRSTGALSRAAIPYVPPNRGRRIKRLKDVITAAFVFLYGKHEGTENTRHDRRRSRDWAEGQRQSRNATADL